MDANEYQRLTAGTEIYTETGDRFLNDYINRIDDDAAHTHADARDMLSLMYCAGKLNGEAGEVAELVFKAYRGGGLSAEARSKLHKELGDVMWYVARLAGLLGFSLEGVMKANIDKLRDRKKRGVIHGYGDER